MTGQLKCNVKNLKLDIYIGRIYILSMYRLRALQPITDL